MFGPKKLPELAKAVGDAVRRYRESSSGIVSEPEKNETPEDVMIKAAEKLGIKTEGKTKDELAQEIAKAVAEEKSK